MTNQSGEFDGLAALVHAWPMQHPELAVVAWSVGMLVVFAPLALRKYRRKVLG